MQVAPQINRRRHAPGDGQHEGGTGKAGDHSVPEAQLPYLLTARYGDKGRGPSRRVQGPAQHHNGDGCGHAKADGPEGRQPLRAGHTDQGRKKVPSQQIAWTGQGTVRGREQQDCRGSERPYQHGDAVISHNEPVQSCYQQKAATTSQPGPPYPESTGSLSCQPSLFGHADLLVCV